jgi:hypothetical protein
MPHRHHRPAGHADHPDPQERTALEGRLPGRNRQKRNPTSHYGRAFWKRWTGYHARSRIEAKMRCLKAFGERIAARHPDIHTAEIQIRVALINRFNALGTAEIVRVV